MSNLFLPLIKLGWSIVSDSKNLHYEMSLSKETTFIMWDRPGLNCTDEELKKIVDDLKTIIRNSNDRDIPEYGVLLGEREDMKTRLISIVYSKGQPIGFSAQAHIDFRIGLKHVSVIHLGLVYLDKNVRGGGMTGVIYALPSLLLLLKSGLRPQWVSNVTQVPAIFGLVEDFYSNPYPCTRGSTQTFEHFIMANKIMKDYRHVFGVGDDCDYDPKEQIIKNAYTGGSDNLKKTFEEAPKSRNPKVNEFFKDKLDFDRGDDFLQLAVLDYKLLFKFVGSKAVKSKFAYSVLNIAFLFMASLLVPLSRWIISEEDTHV